MESLLSTISEGVIWTLRLNLYLFTIVGVLLTFRVLQYRWRLRSVKLYWYARPLGIVPLFASFFLAMIVALLLIPDDQLPFITPTDLKVYFLMAFCLFVLSRQISLVYVTSHGIVKNLINPSQTIPWFQIVDYLKQPMENGIRYVFIYKLQEDELKPQRINLDVPLRKQAQFQKVVEKHLN